MYGYRNRKKIILKKIALVLLMIAPIIGIAFICNNVVARYSGSLKQDLTFIAYPNNAYNYYIYDNAGARTGAYDSANSITETFTVRATTQQTIYQIKLPVTEEGYYRLSFMVDFLKNGATSKDLACSTNSAKSIGCRVVHEEDYPFGKSSSILTLSSTDSVASTDGIRVTHSAKPLWQADDHYIWKTLAPSLAERVNLTYKVTSSDVDHGYVIWAWTFYGLVASTKYTITLTEIDSTKLDIIDSDKPYLDFTKMQYVNNTINPDSCSVYGYTRNAPGKGTYVTEASNDSLTMQVAPLYAAWNSSSDYKETNISNLAGEGYSGADGTAYENLIGLNIPLKNVEYDKNYKVTFDFSIARQGTTDTDTGALNEEDVLYDSSYSRFFWNLESDNVARTLHFQSYLHSGAVSGRQISTHTSGRGQIALKNATYSPHEVTRFDEFRQLTNGTSSNDFVYNSGTAINSLTNNPSGAKNIKFFNSVRHTEVNGQNELYWLTFYNTTFTFNISSTLNSSKNLNLDDLYWVWGIDAIRPGKWYRLKIENVRVEEVEQYGSNVNWNGIKVAGTQVTKFNYYNQETQTEETYLRGANGTGQNYQALQGTTRSNGTTTPGIPMASVNTYGPIYDASSDIVAVGAKDTSGKTVKGDNDYKVHIDGYCVVKGGVDRYVWSADYGETWHDMIIETPLGEADITTLAYAERRVDQAQRATIDTQKYYARYPSYFNDTLIDESVDADGYRLEAKDHTNDYVDFVKADGVNSVFTGFRMYADISQYAGVWDLDIIFAAVPKTNSKARCELLRITNLNVGTLYRSMIYDVASDIEVTTTYGTYGDSATPKNLNAIDDFTSSNTWADACYREPFKEMKGIAYGVGPSGAQGYALLTNPKSIKSITPLMTGMPIKSTIKIKGWNICAGGTEGYYWSVDEGLTWQPCQGSPATSTSTNTTLVNQAIWWMNNRTLTSEDVVNAIFSGDATALSIDLSAYEGKVVNVVVAAKPVSNAQYCPIAKINSVAVYGDRIFYTRPREITIGGISVSDITQFNSLKFNDASSGHISAQSYSIFEPYNVDLYATRKLTSYSVEVDNGDLVSINGFLMCKGGVKEYKYTVDGGKTWTSIWQRTYDSNGNIVKDFAGPNDGICKAGALISLDFDNSEYANSNFSTAHGATKTLDFNLNTSFTENTECPLLVVAVADDGNDSLIPIIHVDITVIV